jgi:hypothetical protein
MPGPYAPMAIGATLVVMVVLNVATAEANDGNNFYGLAMGLGAHDQR